MSSDQFIEAFGRAVPASPKEALPVVTFDDSVTLHMNGETIEVVHIEPAHTDGDSVVFFKKANVLHTGDLFFNGLYPFIDVSSGGGRRRRPWRWMPKEDSNGTNHQHHQRQTQ